MVHILLIVKMVPYASVIVNSQIKTVLLQDDCHLVGISEDLRFHGAVLEQEFCDESMVLEDHRH